MPPPNDITKPKRCSICGFEIDREHADKYFPHDKSKRDGLRSHCKNCTHKEHLARAKTRREENRLYAHQYYQSHRQERLIWQRAYYNAHSKEDTERKRQWRKTPEGKLTVRIRASKRRHLLQKSSGYTKSDVQLQIKAQTDKKGHLRCWWCGKPIIGAYHIDHVIPLVKGGSNNPENIVISHGKCNQKKGAKLPSEFAGRLF